MLGLRPICGQLSSASFELLIVGDNLKFFESNAVRRDYYLYTCDFFMLNEVVRRIINVSASDTITFVFSEKEMYVDTLMFTESVITNWDDDDACEGDDTDTVDDEDDVSFDEEVGCVIDHNITVNETFTLNESGAWSPI